MKNVTYVFLLLSGCLSIAAAAAAGGSNASVFQMRLVAGAEPETPPAGNYDKVTATRTNSLNGSISRETLYVDKTVLLDHHDLQTTKVVTNTPTAQFEIDFELTAVGRKRFAEVTRQNIGKRLAIIIDGQVISAPVIRGEISGGKGKISGNFTPQEAQELSEKINAALQK